MIQFLFCYSPHAYKGVCKPTINSGKVSETADLINLYNCLLFYGINIFTIHMSFKCVHCIMETELSAKKHQNIRIIAQKYGLHWKLGLKL